MGSTKREPQRGKATQTMPVDATAATAAGATQGKPRKGERDPSLHTACALSVEERRWLVEELAHSHAEKRGFAPGEEWRDWFEVEAKVKRLSR